MSKTQTLHPDPNKQGVNIDTGKYETIRQKILDVLSKSGPMKFMVLATEVSESLPDFDGSATWYCETVKLDLEARGVISHDRTAQPAVISLIEAPNES